MYASVETDSGPGLSTAQGISFDARCSICDTELAKQYYRVNGHEICSNCRRPVMSELVGQHGSTLHAFLRGWLFGALTGLSGYIVYLSVMTVLRGFSSVAAIVIGPLVWKLTSWANPGCSLAYRIIAIGITYGSIALSSLPGILQNLIEERVIDPQSMSDFSVSVLSFTIEWVVPVLQHPACFLVILLTGFGFSEIIRLWQYRASLIQGPFPITRRLSCNVP
jgi:hypothetical protein